MNARGKKPQTRDAARRGRPAWLVVIGASLVLVGPGCAAEDDRFHDRQTSHGEVVVVIEPRTPYLTTFSCQEQCHTKLEPNPERRDLTEFHTIRPVSHGPAIDWCTFCHRVEDIDNLRLIDNQPITFDDSHMLCGQCHGDKYRDWETGVHGSQTGSWNGTQVRRSCPFCHDPHVPGIPHVEALPPPDPPRGQAPRSGHEE